jgi:hypothetical protein
MPSLPTRLLDVDHIKDRGRDFFEVACAYDLEGHRGQAGKRSLRLGWHEHELDQDLKLELHTNDRAA